MLLHLHLHPHPHLHLHVHLLLHVQVLAVHLGVCHGLALEIYDREQEETRERLEELANQLQGPGENMGASAEDAEASAKAEPNAEFSNEGFAEDLAPYGEIEANLEEILSNGNEAYIYNGTEEAGDDARAEEMMAFEQLVEDEAAVIMAEGLGEAAVTMDEEAATGEEVAAMVGKVLEELLEEVTRSAEEECEQLEDIMEAVIQGGGVELEPAGDGGASKEGQDVTGEDEEVKAENEECKGEDHHSKVENIDSEEEEPKEGKGQETSNVNRGEMDMESGEQEEDGMASENKEDERQTKGRNKIEGSVEIEKSWPDPR